MDSHNFTQTDTQFSELAIAPTIPQKLCTLKAHTIHAVHPITKAYTSLKESSAFRSWISGCIEINISDKTRRIVSRNFLLARIP